MGVGEHPLTGGIYTVENSADEITRQGVNIHQDNPGEELNFLGYLNGTQYADQGRNFGCMCYGFFLMSSVGVGIGAKKESRRLEMEMELTVA